VSECTVGTRVGATVGREGGGGGLDRRVGEQLLQRHLAVELRAEVAEERDCQERVPAEVEEAVGDVETRRRELEHAPEDLRYLGEGAAVSDFTTRFVDTRRAS
jgi:hypothetical protein